MNETADSYITLPFGTALRNAALLGFYNVLEARCKRIPDDYDEIEKIKGSTDGLTFSARLLDGLETDWINTMVQTFGNTTACHRLLSEYERLTSRGAEDSDKFAENTAAFFEDLQRKVTSASYKSAFITRSNNGDNFAAEAAIKKIKAQKQKEPREILSELAPLVAFLARNKRLFMMKDISYTIINHFWEGIAFMNRQRNTVDIESCFADEVAAPAYAFAAKPQKGKAVCAECGAVGNSGEMSGMAWISDVGVDINRKKSNFWNFAPDLKVCPICVLVYCCLPLGFTMVGSQGIFVNSNASIEELISVNRTFSAIKEYDDVLNLGGANRAFSRVKSRAFLSLCETQRAKQQSRSLQVLTRIQDADGNDVYHSELLSPLLLALLESRREDMLYLSRWNVRLSEKHYINLFDEVISAAENGVLPHETLLQAFRVQWQNNASLAAIKALLRVQAYIISERRKITDTMEEYDKLYKLTQAVIAEGNKLRQLLWKEGDTADDINNKLRSYVYKLINQSHTMDRAGFMDTLSRLYMGAGKPIAINLISPAFQSDEMFMQIADAFILGLGGEYYRKNADEENREEKQ